MVKNSLKKFSMQPSRIKNRREGFILFERQVTMEDKQIFMKQKPVLKLLLSMSISSMISMLIQSLYNIIDSIYVTKLGNGALHAVSLAFPLQNASLAVGVGVGIGIGSLISRALGGNDKEKANRAVSVGLLLVFIHCVLFVLLGIFVTKPFLQLFTEDPMILKDSMDYTYIVLCLSFGQLIQMYLEKLLQALGKVKTIMAITLTGCIINVVLDPILIFGYLGFPAMGVKGAAIATVVGQICSMIICVIVCFKIKLGVQFRMKYFRLDGAIIKEIYSVGIPSSLMLILPSVLTGILNGILGDIGDVYVPVFGLYFKLQSFVNLPANGLIQGMRPIVSYNYGAGEKERVKKTVLYSTGIVFVMMLFGTICSLAIPSQILTLFDADEELMQYGVTALRILGTGFVVSTISVVACGVLEALGKGKESLFISILRQLVIVVPLGWLLSLKWGANGIWIAFPIAEAFTTIVSCLLMFRIRTASLKDKPIEEKVQTEAELS